MTILDGPQAWSGAGYPGAAAGISRDPALGVYTYPAAERPATLWRLLADSAARWPHRVALTNGAVTYGALVERAEAVAAAWHAAGVGAGDRVAILAANGVPFVVAFFAAQRLGAVAVCLNTKLAAPELAWQVGDCAAGAIVVEREFVDKAPRLPLTWMAEDLPRGDPGHLPPPGDGSVILYTSGTTGRPKGCVLTGFNLGHTVVSYARCFALGPDDRTLIAVPIFHVTGLAAQLLTLLYVGGSCALLPRFSAAEALEWLVRQRITHMLSVPTVYAMLVDLPDRGDADLSAWRIGAYGGAAMPAAVIGDLRRWLPGLDLRNTYGLTEVASPAVIAPPGPDPDTVGLPVPVGECRLGADDELLIRGPMVTPGYWGRGASTEDGWLRTGDVAAIRGSRVAIRDRLKDMINRGGEKVHCLEVEDALCSHPAVLEAAVVGIPDRVYGERVVAFVVPRARAAPEPDALRRHVAARLARYKVPERITLLPELPRNASGKVEKGRLRS